MKKVYEKAIRSLIESYFRDYHEHRHGFLPLFLINDIQRMHWQTMCLNYEHRRNRRSEDISVKGKNHLKNLKLKFSRMLTCFSSIIPLALPSNTPISEESVYQLAIMRPLERIFEVASDVVIILVNVMVTEYAWFLVALEIERGNRDMDSKLGE